MKAKLLTGQDVPKHTDLVKVYKPMSAHPLKCSLGEIFWNGNFYYVYTGYDCIEFSNLSKVEQAIKQTTKNR